MTITIDGRPISKKNSKNVGVNKYTSRIYVTASKQWKAFEKYALEQLLPYKKFKFKNRIFIEYTFYFKGRGFVDIDNAMNGINDVLEQSGIIDNDRNLKKGGFEIIENCEDWHTDIYLEQL